jgi:hypothetical protein
MAADSGQDNRVLRWATYDRSYPHKWGRSILPTYKWEDGRYTVRFAQQRIFRATDDAVYELSTGFYRRYTPKQRGHD